MDMTRHDSESGAVVVHRDPFSSSGESIIIVMITTISIISVSATYL